MKLIFKNLMAQRRRNIWLFLEMIVVAVVTWVVIDPVMVLLSVGSWSKGYEQDRLVYMELGLIKPRSPRYSAEAADSAEMVKSFDVIVDRMKNMPDVESVTPVGAGLRIDGGWSSNMGLNYVGDEGDTLRTFVYLYGRPIGRDYFTTYGMRPVAGSPSAAELSSMPMGDKDIIITESLARQMFGERDSYIGLCTADNFDDGTGVGRRIVGVIEDVRPWQSKGVSRVLWRNEDFDINDSPETSALAIRLSDSVTPQEWINKHGSDARAGSYAGNLYIKYIDTYASIAATTWQDRSATSEKRLKIVLLVFFLVNLALGVAGTFYLQTRQRSHDAGIMKSFGATRGNVFRSLVGEAMLITVAGWLIGCLLYVHYGMKEGLSVGIDWNNSYLPDGCWIVNFWEHFGIVSAAVLVVLAVIVLIGVSLPARRIARVNPVDAIRDE